MSQWVQIVVALAVVAGLYGAALAVWNRDETKFLSLGSDVEDREIVTVAEVADSEMTFNTLDKDSPLYVRMPSPRNQKGGAEITYMCFVKFSEAVGASTSQTLVQRGEGATVCPRISVAGGKLRAEFNTISYNNDGDREPGYRANHDEDPPVEMSLESYPATWAHLAVAISDTTPGMDLVMRDKIRITFFVNGEEKETVYADNCKDVADISQVCRTQLLLNRGPISVLAAGGSGVARVEQVKYANYRMTLDEIRSEMKKKMPKDLRVEDLPRY